jgi:hypothetical protein
MQWQLTIQPFKVTNRQLPAAILINHRMMCRNRLLASRPTSLSIETKADLGTSAITMSHVPKERPRRIRFSNRF